MKNLILILLTVLIWPNVSVSQCADLPVPLRTINVSNQTQFNNAFTAAQPGDHIVLQVNGLSIPNSGNWNKSGTQANPIVIRANTVLGQTIGSNGAINASDIILYGLDFPNCRFTVGASNTSNRVKFWRCRWRDLPAPSQSMGLRTYVCNDIDIAYCEWTNWGGRGISFGIAAGTQRPVVRRCLFRNTPASSGYTNAHEAIQVGFGNADRLINSGTIIEFCRFTGWNSDDETISIKSSNVIIRQITFENNVGRCGNRLGKNNRFEAITFIGSAGIRIHDQGNLVLGCDVSAANQGLRVATGNHDAETPMTTNETPNAVDVHVAGCTGNITVGHAFTGHTIDAKDTRIREHTGTITLVSGNHVGTDSQPFVNETLYTWAARVVLANGDVGPMALCTTTPPIQVDSIFSQVSYFGNSMNWTALTPERWDVSTNGGDTTYCLNTTDFNPASGNRLGEYSLVKDSIYNDFTMTLKARSTEDLTANTWADYDIVFGFQNQNEYCFLMVSAQPGTTKLHRVTGGVSTIISPPSAQLITDNAFHDIAIERIDSTVTVKYDGVNILTDTDERYSLSGGIGVGSMNDQACFDDVHIERITTPGCITTSSTTNITACNSYLWTNGTTYTSSGNYTQNLSNAKGCDSVVTLNLTIKNATSGTDTKSACTSYTWIDGNTYTANNNSATHTLTNAAGCDSVVTLNLTIKNATSSTDIKSACTSYTWIDGNTYTSNNNSATHTLTNAVGCDSVVTLNLTITNIDITTSTSGNIITANESGASYQWVDCNNSNQLIAGEINQSFTATASGDYAVIITAGICSDTSNCINIITTGKNENVIEHIKFYPNPTSDYIIVDIENNRDIVNYTITSIDGKIVAEGKTIEKIIKLDLTEENKGFYFLTIKQNGSIINYKIIKQ